MTRCFPLFCLFSLALFGAADSTFGFDLSYWAWQRSEPLSEAEQSELVSQGVHTIYWHVGELENQAADWKWKARYRFPPETEHGVRFVPVVRLVSRSAQPFKPQSIAALVAALTPVAHLTGDLQLDFDSPDRLVDDYAKALHEIHEVVRGHLSITALPHWSRANFLSRISGNVDELFPMLYDYEAEPVLPNDRSPQPLIQSDHISKMLREWSGCPKPWQAGLPCFARLTLYDGAGKSRGQIRNWNWDELVFNPDLRLRSGQDSPGTLVLRSERSGVRIANNRLDAGDQLVVRMTDRGALREAGEFAKGTSARGVVLFRLPDSAASSGWSLRQLGHLNAPSNFSLKSSAEGESLTLKNCGDGDLPPVWPRSPANLAGYVVEVEFPSPIIREAEQGDFVSVTTYAAGEKSPRPAAAPFATQLSFAFSNLRAGQSLSTGLIQLAPGATFRQARWRIRNADETWKTLE